MKYLAVLALLICLPAQAQNAQQFNAVTQQNLQNASNQTAQVNQSAIQTVLHSHISPAMQNQIINQINASLGAAQQNYQVNSNAASASLGLAPTVITPQTTPVQMPNYTVNSLNATNAFIASPQPVATDLVNHGYMMPKQIITMPGMNFDKLRPTNYQFDYSTLKP